MTRRALHYLGHAAVSGALGWVVLIAAFEGAYWADAWMRRKG